MPKSSSVVKSDVLNNNRIGTINLKISDMLSLLKLDKQQHGSNYQKVFKDSFVNSKEEVVSRSSDEALEGYKPKIKIRLKEFGKQ